MNKRPIQVIQMGLGPIGQRLVADLANRSMFQLVAAIDIDPEKTGQDAGALSGVSPLGVQVSADAQAVLSGDADVVLLTTNSGFATIEPQLELCIKARKSVVSTCEELAFPFLSQPKLSAAIDKLAKEHCVAVLGTGVNPGFLMDTLAVFLTSVCRRVDRIKIERFQDAAQRRLPFQQKIGAGLTREAFEAKLDQRSIRHVGFTESVHLIGQTLGCQLDRVEDHIEPVIVDEAVSSQFIQVAAGRCAGLRQFGRGYRDGEEVITLELQAYLGHPDPRDTITIHGEPEVRSNIAGGVNGDIATCSMVLSAIPALLAASPGLRTMADIPLTHWCAGP